MMKSIIFFILFVFSVDLFPQNAFTKEMHEMQQYFDELNSLEYTKNVRSHISSMLLLGVKINLQQVDPFALQCVHLMASIWPNEKDSASSEMMIQNIKYALKKCLDLNLLSAEFCNARELPSYLEVIENIENQRPPLAPFYVERRNKRFAFLPLLIPLLISVSMGATSVIVNEFNQQKLQAKVNKNQNQMIENMNTALSNTTISLEQLIEKNFIIDLVIRQCAGFEEEIGSNTGRFTPLERGNPLRETVQTALKDHLERSGEYSKSTQATVFRKSLAYAMQSSELIYEKNKGKYCIGTSLQANFLIPVPNLLSSTLLLKSEQNEKHFVHAGDEWIHSSSDHGLKTCTRFDGQRKECLEGRLCGTKNPVKISFSKSSTLFTDIFSVDTPYEFNATIRCNFGENNTVTKQIIRNNSVITLPLNCNIVAANLYCPLVKINYLSETEDGDHLINTIRPTFEHELKSLKIQNNATLRENLTDLGVDSYSGLFTIDEAYTNGFHQTILMYVGICFGGLLVIFSAIFIAKLQYKKYQKILEEIDQRRYIARNKPSEHLTMEALTNWAGN